MDWEKNGLNPCGRELQAMQNVCITDVIIPTPVDILILQILFKHFEEGVGLGVNQIAHTHFLPDTTIVMYPWINFFLRHS